MTNTAEVATLLEEIAAAIDAAEFKEDTKNAHPGLVAYICEDSKGWRIFVRATPDHVPIDGAASTVVGTRLDPLIVRLTPELAKRALKKALTK
jgi:hypothetical protein